MQKEIKGDNWFEIDKEKNVFRKHMPLEKFESELAMTQRAHELSLKTSLFNTPKIIAQNSQENNVEFELITNVSTFRVYYNQLLKFGISKNKKKELSNNFEKIGASLFLIHNSKSHFNSVVKQTFPKDFIVDTSQLEDVYLHGDFTMNNILYSAKNQQLHIIDWNTSPVFSFSANYGPCFWDMSFFISSMFYYSISSLFSYSTRKSLALDFINGYLKGYEGDKKEFRLSLKHFLEKYNYYILYKKIHSESNNLLHKKLAKFSRNQLHKFIASL